MRRLQPKAFVASPGALEAVWPLADAEGYTRWLATHHYENFHVASLFLPKHLHQDFFNVYSFCRWADDLGDEMESAAESLRLLAWWRRELESMYQGEARHPVFVALKETVSRRRIPIEPFRDLIHAFEEDQRLTRYRDWDRLLTYCTYSANPVGRLVLYLCDYRDEQRQRLSDATCTALQLANFWQDVSVDWQKNRVYIPLEVLYAHGGTIADIAARRPTPGFRAALAECVDRASKLFEGGLPLGRMVSPRISLDVDLFSRGGMRVLEKIRKLDYDVLTSRPYITKFERARLLIASVGRVARSLAA